MNIVLPFPQQETNISACLRRRFYNLNIEQGSAAGLAKTQPTGSVTILLSGKVPNSRVIFPCTLHRPGIYTRVSFGLGPARSRNNEMNGYFSVKIIPMIPDGAMELTISPRTTINCGRLLP